jgi:hypothetical protein
LVILIVLFAHAPAEAVVVSGTNIVFGASVPPPPGNYFGTIYQDVGATDPTSAIFNFASNALQITAINVDQSSDWYLVHAGDQFGPAAIAANQFTQVPVSNTSSINVGSGDFYLGVATSDLLNPPFTRDIFGWVLIHDNNGVLSNGGNAVSYHSPGIIVGTITEIPEPGTITLSGLAAALVVAYQWPARRRRALLGS